MTDNMEKVLSANTTVLAESIGKIMCKISTDMTQNLKGLLSTDQPINTIDNGMGNPQ
jgi:hypothetical protein